MTLDVNPVCGLHSRSAVRRMANRCDPCKLHKLRYPKIWLLYFGQILNEQLWPVILYFLFLLLLLLFLNSSLIAEG